MGLFNFIRSQLIDIIEWTDADHYTLVSKFPDDDHEIKNGAQLICREGQAAVLISEGRLADVFGPGTHTLSTRNLPVLSTLRGWKHGFESPFKVEVYFVSLRQFIDHKWGTSNPVLIRDPEFGVAGRPGRIRLRAFGSYNFKIGDPKRFFSEVVGTLPEVTTDTVERFARSRLVAAFSQAAASSKLSVADMHAHASHLAGGVQAHIAQDFQSLGLTLTSFIVENVSLPAEVEKALDAAAAQSARGVDNTLAWEAMGALRDGVRNQGDSASQMSGAGMGMGMGMGMGQMLAQTLGAGLNQQAYAPHPGAAPAQHGYPPQPGYAQARPPQQPAAPPPAPASAPAGQEMSIKDRLARLESVYEAKLLTEEEYNAKRAEILAEF